MLNSYHADKVTPHRLAFSVDTPPTTKKKQRRVTSLSAEHENEIYSLCCKLFHRDSNISRFQRRRVERNDGPAKFPSSNIMCNIEKINVE